MATILAIDDKQDNLISVSALLKALMPECRVMTASSGPEGIEAARADRPDVILLDIKMPGMDGFAVCRSLKKDEAVRHIPVIMLTAVSTDTKSRIKALELGADAFLSKPIDEMELVAQIKVMLRIKKAEDVLRNERDSLVDRVQERTSRLRESEKQYQMLFNSVQDMVLIHPLHDTDRPKPFIKVNDMACRRLGYSREEMAALSMPEILTEQGAEDFRKECEWLSARKILLFEKNVVTQPGGRIPVEILSRIIEWEGEKVVLSVARDITERRRAEKEKQHLEEKLRQAHKMEAIGTLTGGIAHKFNNLLSIIVGNAELASEDIPKHNPVHPFLGEIIKASLRGKEIVSQLMRFSRPAGQNQHRVGLSKIVADANGYFQEALPAGVKLAILNNASDDQVAGDSAQIHQVVTNLFKNAVQSMAQKEGTLEIRIENRFLDAPLRLLGYELDRGAYVCLRVTDSGVGIAPDHLNRVFDPFFTTKDMAQGSGMGLTVVHGIMKGHGGGVRVLSRPGKGTSVECFFPSFGQAKKKYSSQAAENLPAPEAFKRILFLDDDPAIVKVSKIRLERLGFQVVASSDPLEALSFFNRDPDAVDLVITDLSMPQMDGDQVIRELHARHPAVKTILCTGYNEKIDNVKMGKIGADGVLLKPHSKEELAMTIRTVLEQPSV